MPRSLHPQPKRMRPNQLLPQWQQLQHSNLIAQELALEKTEALSANPVIFCKQILGFTPFAYQEKFIKLFVDNQFTAARWSRQSGKSFIVAAILLWYATTHPESAIGHSWSILSPNKTHPQPHRVSIP